MLLTEELERYKNLIDTSLIDLLNNENVYEKKLIDSIKYSLFSGGKRLRPIFLLKSTELFNGDFKNAMPFAMGIEMIHTYSLIHDDLPSMDNDNYRRGKLTNHMVFGEAMAILSGDGLLNLAFELMLKYTLENSETVKEYEKNIRTINEIGRYSGIYGMIGGQALDLQSDEKNLDEEKLFHMYKSKTAALIQASVVSGAILGGASKNEVKRMREFGLNLGLAYQIKDDLLDCEEDKSVGKTTYLSFHSMEEAAIRIRELSRKALEELNLLHKYQTRFFKDMVNLLIDREN